MTRRGRSAELPGCAPLPPRPGRPERSLGPEQQLVLGGGGPRLRELEDLLFSPVALDSPWKCQGTAEESPGRERGGRPELAAGAPRT